MDDKSWVKIQNITVDEFTTPCLKTVSPDTELSRLEALSQKEGIRHIPVKDGEQLVGIISERDIFFSYRLDNVSQLRAKDIMRQNPYVVDSSAKLSEVAFCMSQNKYGSALVTSPEGDLGIFTSTDALNALVEIIRGDILSSL